MSYFFAKIEMADKIDEVAIKFNFMKNKKILEWYIKRFNPYTMEEIEIGNAKGYKIILPYTKEIQESSPSLAEELLNRTIDELEYNNVVAVEIATDIKSNVNSNIIRCNGLDILNIYIMEVIEKSMKAMDIDKKKAELLLITGDEKLTNYIIDLVTPNVNYFNVIDESLSTINYEDKFQKIFNEYGLNINAFSKNKVIMESADIIINVSQNNNIIKSCKKGSVYIEINDIEKDVYRKNDILQIDGMSIKYEDTFINSIDFELMIYCKSSNFRKLKKFHYRPELINLVKAELNAYGYKLSSLMYNKKVLNSMSYKSVKNCKKKD